MATLAMCGFFILVLSPQDIGAGPDSFAYISAARSFLAGEGFKSVTWDGDFEVMTHFPPFYSFLVAEFSFGKLDLLQSAKWLNAFILFANIFMIGLIIRQLTEHEWLALFGAAIFLTSQLTLLTHSNAWTEPLFMAFAFAAIGLLGLYTKEKRRVWLLLAAIMVGLGAITRYVGVTLIGTTMLLLLLHPYAEKL